ncbi:hypothetical protein BG011_000347 [Mortierella polycephala]|uniref:Exportin-7/Ran-binding protein 17 TPR repeats domain-containing protein n=1 Tax=Mortierella polycephala TaxID=41804 RepID=A0A9P6Q914_9FUNG|nr:hypothetical protein BG011_000347 [Mortierella polycephala]
MTASVDLQTIEQYCVTLYNPPNPSSRAQAESFLNYHCPTFSAASDTGHDAAGGSAAGAEAHSPNVNSPIDSALVCRNLLENSKNPYTLMFATSRLKSLVDEHFTSFTTAEQLGLRSFVLQYIFQYPDLPHFILASQAQLLAIITKLGWAENPESRQVLDHIQVFFQQSVDHRIIGVRILTSIVTEMNIPGKRNVVKHRKSAVGFRDGQLLPIFQAALSMMKTMLQGQQADRDTYSLAETILLLLKSCLGFDFIGASYEESSDDVGSIQVPTAWRPIFQDPEYLTVLWESWKTFSNPVSVVAMECLSQAASIRRSIFSSEETRGTYISHIIQETLLTLNTAAGQTKLQDLGNFHEFCRMLSRFKSTYQIGDIGNCKDSKQWFSAIGEFTEQGFRSWKWSPNSPAYLLTFWNKTVSSLSNAQQDTELLIESITVNLTRAYLKTRLECVHAALDGEVDDPLESEDTLILSLEMFANIARTKYTESGRFIITEFKDLSLKYRELIQRASTFANTTSLPAGSTDVKESLMVVEMQLTWMVYIMAACIGGRVMYQSTSEQDHMDGEFACDILGFVHQLQVWTSQRPPHLASADSHLHVQSAIIYFYTQFRSSYISDDSIKVTPVYTQLASQWGLNSPSQVLDVIMNSSLGNLRSCGDPEWRQQEDQLVLRTIKLFTHLASGYSSVKYIRKLDTTKALLKNHNSSDFWFLDPKKKSSDTEVKRCRTMYYTMLSRILFAEDNIDTDFWRFVKPWELALDRVALAFEGSSDLGEEDVRLILSGVLKDLRGFVTSISNRRQYNLFYEWFFQAYTPIVRRAIEVWPHNEVSIAALRFWHEFATNKSSRVTFDSSSANGILLFRETRYKGTMLYFNIMAVSLSGKYANFGVFKLYGDKALERVLEVFFQLMLAVPLDDMVSYPKLSHSYFSIIDVFAADHMTGLPMMPHPILEYVLRSLGDAIPLQTQDASPSTLACSAIDKICTFVLNWLIRNKARESDNGDEMTDDIQSGSRSGYQLLLSASASNTSTPGRDTLHSRRQRDQQQGTHWLVEYVLSHKDVLSRLFIVLFQVLALESRSNQWSLSRPLLGLILLNREFFVEYTTRFVQAQLPDRHVALQKAVDGLMDGIEENLTTVNRDRFTTNATAFRRECSQMTLMPFTLDGAGGML